MDNPNIIGLIGGTGWASTVEYYSLINEKVNQRLGGFQYARCIIYSLNYGEINELNEKDDLDSLYKMILDASNRLRSAGATCLVLCANTLHLFADQLEKDNPLPLIHIVDATAHEITRNDYSKVGLLGTKRTMLNDFFRLRLLRFGIETIVPEESDRDFVEKTIRQELVRGILKLENTGRYLEIIKKLQDRGAEGIVLGCTEIPLLLKQEHTAVVLYDTTEIHVNAIVEFYLRQL